MEKHLPIFQGNNVLIGEEHIKLFIQAFDVLNFENEDVVLNIIYHSLSKDVKEWNQALPTSSIDSYDRMEELFLTKYGKKKNEQLILTELATIKKKENE